MTKLGIFWIKKLNKVYNILRMHCQIYSITSNSSLWQLHVPFKHIVVQNEIIWTSVCQIITIKLHILVTNHTLHSRFLPSNLKFTIIFSIKVRYLLQQTTNSTNLSFLLETQLLTDYSLLQSMEPECSCSTSDDTSYESDDDNSPPRQTRRRRQQQQRRKLKGKLNQRRGRSPGRQRLVYNDSTSSNSDDTPPRQPSHVHWSLPCRKTRTYASMNCLRYSSHREQSCRSKSSNGLSIGRRRSSENDAGNLWASDDDELITR